MNRLYPKREGWKNALEFWILKKLFNNDGYRYDIQKLTDYRGASQASDAT